MLPERACKFACVHALFCQRERGGETERERQKEREREREGRSKYVTCKRENEKGISKSIVDCRFV